MCLFGWYTKCRYRGLHACVWYTELTCISNGVSKTDIMVGKVVCVCVSVCLCVCVLTDGGALPLPGPLNHWGRYLPKGPTTCILCASGGATPIAGRP